MPRLPMALLMVIAAAVLHAAQAFVTGDAPGIASGTTGGGDTVPVYPTSLDELKTLLADLQPRVVVLNRTFDFCGSEGRVNEIGCRPESNRECIAKNNGFVGQDVIQQSGGFNSTGGCTEREPVEISYDAAAAKTKLWISDNKTLRGEGTLGVIVGKGLAIAGDNVIVQNIHITDLNPHVVWGGDALFIQGKKDDATGDLVAVERVWIDHVKLSLIGRQMIAVNKSSAKSLTISNSEFDGQTPYSATCDGRHYWTMLFLGIETRINLIGNYIHDTSGRSPKVGGDSNPSTDVVLHAVNNHWFNNTASSFDVQSSAYVLIEGNIFEATGKPNLRESSALGAYLVPSPATQELCANAVGRMCIENDFATSGAFASKNESVAAARVRGVATYTAQEPRKLVLAARNYGVGELET